MNFKQEVAFGLIRRHILNVKVHGQDNVQQLLLNISGTAGTGNNFFINTVKILSKEDLGRDRFLQAAASSGTSVNFINGNTIHSLLYLPVGTNKCLPLHSERLKGMHDTFSNVDILSLEHDNIVNYTVEHLSTRVTK